MTSSPQSKRARVDHMSQREWLLLRPDTFVGPTAVIPLRMAVFSEATAGKVSSLTCERVTVEASPALLSLANELSTNALDAGHRMDADHPQRRIALEWCPDEGTFVVKNDGPTLSIIFNEQHQWWDPQAAFGEFQSGTNFDDEEKRFTAGRNGLGSKACNTYSTKMHIRIDNATDGKTYEQTWTDNMSHVGKPRIVKCSKKSHETTVEWTPDASRLGGIEQIRATMPSVIRWMAFNASLCAAPNVKVTLNGQVIGAKTPEHFCRALGGSGPYASDQVTDASGRVVLRVCVAARTPEVEASSTSLAMGFVNSTPCSEGTHAKLVLQKVADILNQKLSKEAQVTSGFVKANAVAVAVFAVVNPRFSSQTKECLDLPVREYGWKWEPSAAFRGALERSQLIERAREIARARDDATAAKATKTTPSTRAPRFDKYDPALKLGTPRTTLIVTEGDSAKNFAVSGISEVGRQFFGVYPIRGKFLNVRGISSKTIAENKEAHELLRILGLQLGATYDAKSVAKLPYGRLMLMTDMDPDGSHIAALLINFIETVAPSLLKLKPDFICRFATSLVRVTLPHPEAPIGFYSQAEYDAWRRARLAEGRSVGSAKYFKGLGTSSSALAKQYFRELARNTITLQHDGLSSAEGLDLFFNKKRVDDRKIFLSSDACSPDSYIDYAESSTSIDTFVRRELLPQHGLSSIRRAIPSAIDGFNEAKRKVLHGARAVGMTERQLKAQGHGSSIKVSEAAGKVSAKSHYHHGGTSLEDTIVGMACDYVGSGNLNILFPEGQFGTRHNRSASASRYIETRLNDPLQSLLFPRADDAVLRHVEEDGRSAEPEHFFPVLATALVFGLDGIATGWSTKIPPYHPLHLIRAAREWMELGDDATPSDLTPLTPWWRGFEGTVRPVEGEVANGFVVRGCFERKNGEVHITELPPFKETDAVISDLSKRGLDLPLKGSGHTDEKVHLILNSGEIPATDEELEKRIGLSKTINFGNVHMLDEKGILRKYDDPREVVWDHAKARLEVYEKRRAYAIAEGEEQARLAQDRARFIRMCIQKEFDMSACEDEASASRELEKLGFLPWNASRPSEEEDAEVPSAHKHLTRLPQSSLTQKRAAQIERASVEALSRVESLRAQTAIDMWKQELNDLEHYLQEDPKFRC